jgi:hypothetical protein
MSSGLEEETQEDRCRGCNSLELKVPACGPRNTFLVLSVAALGRKNRSAGEGRKYVQIGDVLIAAAAAAAVVVQVKPVPGIGRQNWSRGILLMEM